MINMHDQGGPANKGTAPASPPGGGRPSPPPPHPPHRPQPTGATIVGARKTPPPPPAPPKPSLPPTPPPPGAPPFRYPQRAPNTRGSVQAQEYGPPPGGSSGRAGLPLWAWGTLAAVLVVVLGASVALLAILSVGQAGSSTGSGQPPVPVGQTPVQGQGPGQIGANAGPPTWVKPGLRVTFWGAAASVAESYYAWVEDPEGEWQDPKTGKRYRRTDESGESMGGAAGEGYYEVDVLAVEGLDVVWSSTLHTISRNGTTMTFGPPIIIGGGKSSGGVLDGTWINPAVLVQLQDTNLEGVRVVRGPYRLNGVTYKAIAFARTGPTGSYLQYTYDTETGLLLSATTRTKGATSPVHAEGEAPPQGNTQLTVIHLAGYRQRAVPGVDGMNPGWLANTRELHYSGTYFQGNPVDPRAMVMHYPMEVSVTLGEEGRNWARYNARTQIQIPGSMPTDTNGATGTSGLYWIDQQALAALRPQQVLDRDPVTGQQLEVASVDRGSGSAGGTVTIASRIPGVEATAVYRLSTGVLVHYRVVAQNTAATVDMTLQNEP